MMKMAWTAWTTSGGHTSLSSPTRRVDENKSLSFCCFTVILGLLLRTISGHHHQSSLLQIAGHLPTPCQPRVFTLPPSTHMKTRRHKHSSFCFCMKLYLSLRSHAVAATVYYHSDLWSPSPALGVMACPCSCVRQLSSFDLSVSVFP